MIASRLASWAAQLAPDTQDLALAQRSLIDTVAVTVAARRHPISSVLAGESEAMRWAALSHVLDFDDLHMASTAHISAICVPAVLSCGGDALAYLAGAGVMARLGTLLGWSHYTGGWHATCTAGAPAAAVAAGIAFGLSEAELATAIALAVPAAGGVQRAFGTHAKPLQVGFAVAAGIRAARLARAGATADPAALEQWLGLVGAAGSDLDGGPEGGMEPAVPGGLAIKIYPCCYAMQRPIAAVQAAADGLASDRVTAVRVQTPAGTLQPLIHRRPKTGLQGKFSLSYAVAATLLDRHPGFASFEDESVQRPEAQRLMGLVEVAPTPGGDGLLDGDIRVELELDDGTTRSAMVTLPPGAPGRPPTPEEMRAKLLDCGVDLPPDLTWSSAAEQLRAQLPVED